VPTPIEDVVIAVGGLLEADGIAEEADDVRGKAAYCFKDFNATRRRLNGSSQ